MSDDILYPRQSRATLMLEASKCAPDSLQALAEGPILDPGRLYLPQGKISAAKLAEREAGDRANSIAEALLARARSAERRVSTGEAK